MEGLAKEGEGRRSVEYYRIGIIDIFTLLKGLTAGGVNNISLLDLITANTVYFSQKSVVLERAGLGFVMDAGFIATGP